MCGWAEFDRIRRNVIINNGVGEGVLEEGGGEREGVGHLLETSFEPHVAQRVQKVQLVWLHRCLICPFSLRPNDHRHVIWNPPSLLPLAISRQFRCRPRSFHLQCRRQSVPTKSCHVRELCLTNVGNCSKPGSRRHQSSLTVWAFAIVARLPLFRYMYAPHGSHQVRFDLIPAEALPCPSPTTHPCHYHTI